MARRKDNIVYHNMRMNLDNEQHRRIHMVLTDLNTNVHKSVNQFLIDATDAYIRKLEGNELTNEEKAQPEEHLYITRGDLDKIRREIKDELQKEMIGILTSHILTEKIKLMQEMQIPNAVPEQRYTETRKEDEADADETTIGLASSWG